MRIRRLQGDHALGGVVTKRLQGINGVSAVVGNVRTASVLMSFDPALNPQVVLREVERALSEVLGSWQRPDALPDVTSTLPLREATVSEVLGAAGRLLAKLMPEPGTRVEARSEESGEHAAPSQVVRIDDGSAPRWHVMAVEEIFGIVRTDRAGLSEEEAALRQEQFGPNALPEPPRRSRLEILLSQVTSVPVAMLGVSALLSIATGGLADAAAILAVVLVNAGIGYITESKAERIISSLGRAAHPEVEVFRAGQRRVLPLEAIVPGDVLTVSAGTFIPADARLIFADGLVVDESALTGESVPVHKDAGTLHEPRMPLGDRLNMVFRGTLVTGGSGLAVVVATGTDTEIGQVQSLVGSVVQRETPLQKQLSQLGMQLAVGAGSVCALVFGIGLLRGYPPLRMLGTSVSLAVAAIPEGLPTVAVTTLALGIRRLAARRVWVRQLNAVETLGAIQVMCLDKTGTITVNHMTSAAVFVGMQDIDVERELSGVTQLDAARARDLEALLTVAALCNETDIRVDDGVSVLNGSPTESALIQLAIDRGMDVPALRRRQVLLATQYRSEGRSYMATLHRSKGESPRLAWAAEQEDGGAPGGLWVSVKGRSSEVLAMCSHHLRNGQIHELAEDERRSIEMAGERMAGRALRVLGFACARWAPDRDNGSFTLAGAGDLVWLGLVGMSDPPRDGMRDTLARFHAAGVRTVMITGDQSSTAYSIGRSVGLSPDEHLEILDSMQLEGIAPEVLGALAQRIHIFSRVSPAHKLRIVEALQRAGKTVAMTGDGINDSPALRAADVGVAMGGTGTSAAREVADVILEDDELSTMIEAIEQGRTIYDDIRKAVRFILATNMSEILLTLAGVAAGLPGTLTPMQLLWINLMTDIAPELALAVQPPEADVLRRPPRDPRRAMFDRGDLGRLAVEGGILTLAPLGAYAYGRARYGLGPRAGTLAFTVLASAQLFHVLSSRSERHSIFDAERLASNRYVPMALGGGLALQILATLVPGLRRVLGVVPLGLVDWAVVGVGAVAPLLVNESMKVALRERTDAAEVEPSPAATSAGD